MVLSLFAENGQDNGVYIHKASVVIMSSLDVKDEIKLLNIHISLTNINSTYFQWLSLASRVLSG